MSTLELKELSAPAGEVIKIAAGKTLDLKTQGSVTMPTGSVLQVVSHTNSAVNATTSTSWVATNSTVTITPSSTSSKIYLVATAPIYGSGDNQHTYTTIYRGSTNVNGTAELQLHSAGTSSAGRWSNGSMSFLDSPSTTSATTYTVYQRVYGAGTSHYDGNGGMAIITAMEIQG